MNRPLPLPPPLALKVIHLAEAEFRAALPHLEALRCRWAARPVGMWLPANEVEAMKYQTVPAEERACVRLIRPMTHAGPPLWYAQVGGTTAVMLSPMLDGQDAGSQVELHLLDVLSGE